MQQFLVQNFCYFNFHRFQFWMWTATMVPLVKPSQHSFRPCPFDSIWFNWEVLGPVGGEKTHRCKRKFGKDIKQNPMHISIYIYIHIYTLPKTNISPEHGWLEDEFPLWCLVYFEVRLLKNSGSADGWFWCAGRRRRFEMFGTSKTGGNNWGTETLESNSSGRSGKMRMCLVKL